MFTSKGLILFPNEGLHSVEIFGLKVCDFASADGDPIGVVGTVVISLSFPSEGQFQCYQIFLPGQSIKS